MSKGTSVKFLSPKNSISFKQIYSLSSDNHDTSEGWICIDESTVTLCSQLQGKTPTGSVTLSRRTFNNLIKWYFKEQKIKPRKK